MHNTTVKGMLIECPKLWRAGKGSMIQAAGCDGCEHMKGLFLRSTDSKNPDPENITFTQASSIVKNAERPGVRIPRFFIDCRFPIYRDVKYLLVSEGG